MVCLNNQIHSSGQVGVRPSAKVAVISQHGDRMEVALSPEALTQ